MQNAKWLKKAKKGDFAYQKLLMILLAIILFFILLTIIMKSGSFMESFLPKIFRFGR